MYYIWIFHSQCRQCLYSWMEREIAVVRYSSTRYTIKLVDESQHYGKILKYAVVVFALHIYIFASYHLLHEIIFFLIFQCLNHDGIGLVSLTFFGNVWSALKSATAEISAIKVRRLDCYYIIVYICVITCTLLSTIYHKQCIDFEQ